MYIILAQSVSIAGKIDVHSLMRSRVSGESKFPQVGSKQSKFHQEWWWPTPCAKDFLCWLKLDERLEPAVPNPGHAAGPSEQFPACFVSLPLQQRRYIVITSQYFTLLYIRILLLHHYYT